MLSVGKTLKRARLEQGLDLCTVAAQTKISAKYLEAIESDDRKMLPSGFFYKSFVEQYAKSLSLDTQEIDAEVDRVLSAENLCHCPVSKASWREMFRRLRPPTAFTHRRCIRQSSVGAGASRLLGSICVVAWGASPSA